MLLEQKDIFICKTGMSSLFDIMKCVDKMLQQIS